MQPTPDTKPIRGRGVSENPTGHFEKLRLEVDPAWSDLPEADRPAPRTEYFRDTSQSIIAYNNSPDIPFRASLNPYRGCEHGWMYYRF